MTYYARDRELFDLHPYRPRIRRGLAAGETLDELMAAVGWHGKDRDSFRRALSRQLGITPQHQRSAHAGTSKLSLPSDYERGA